MRELLDREDRILDRHELAERWRRYALVAGLACLMVIIVTIGLPFVIPIFDWLPQGGRITSIVTNILIGLSVTCALTAFYALPVLIWLGVWCRHAEYIKVCRASGDSARTGHARRRDDRVYRNLSGHEYAATTARGFGLFFLILSGVAIPLTIAALHGSSQNDTMLISLLGVCLVFSVMQIAALYLISHAKYWYARSVQHYRASNPVGN